MFKRRFEDRAETCSAVELLSMALPVSCLLVDNKHARPGGSVCPISIDQCRVDHDKDLRKLDPSSSRHKGL